MCPGLTSPGAKLYPAAVDTIVVSFPGSAEKCVHCVLVITERTNIQENIRCIFLEVTVVSFCLHLKMWEATLFCVRS